MPYKDKENRNLAVKRYREKLKKDNRDNRNPLRDNTVIPEIPDRDNGVIHVIPKINMLRGDVDYILKELNVLNTKVENIAEALKTAGVKIPV